MSLNSLKEICGCIPKAISLLSQVYDFIYKVKIQTLNFLKGKICETSNELECMFGFQTPSGEATCLK